MHYIRIWSSRTGNVLHSSRESAFVCLLFNKVEEVQHSIVIPSDSHSGINYPPFANANGFETTDCLECLQILDILIYGRRVCFKAGDWTLCTILDIVHYIRIWSSRTENILHAFLHSNIEESTFHHLRWSPSLSREENVSHASVNQLLHSCPLQEENIPFHSCNLQGLHGPGPEAYCLDY